MSFEQFKLNRQLLNAIEDAGFKAPTEIQRQAITKILAGQNIIGIAQTGTGKTAAYVLPLLRILNYAQGNEPRCLVIVPTRELVLQVQKVFQQLAKYTDIRIAAVYGGGGTKLQKEELKKGCDVVVGTPAQVLQMYLDAFVVFKKIKHFVLDEAERLMDKGFTPQLHSLLEVLPRKRQNLLFSATFGERVKKVADDFILFPTILNIEPEIKTAPAVSQLLYHVPNLKTKLNLLIYLLNNKEMNKVIVFCKSKKIANDVYTSVAGNFGAENCRVVHGNKTQQSRINAVNAFDDKSRGYLITTDVAARGMDISNVSHVINFDVPLIYEDYVHRIGRTGRAFASGSSITFCTPAEEWHVKKIEKFITQEIPVKKLPAEIEIAETAFEESQLMKREIDGQMRKDDPKYKGAFHEKKYSNRERKQ